MNNIVTKDIYLLPLKVTFLVVPVFVFMFSEKWHCFLFTFYTCLAQFIIFNWKVE